MTVPSAAVSFLFLSFLFLSFPLSFPFFFLLTLKTFLGPMVPYTAIFSTPGAVSGIYIVGKLNQCNCGHIGVTT